MCIKAEARHLSHHITFLAVSPFIHLLVAILYISTVPLLLAIYLSHIVLFIPILLANNSKFITFCFLCQPIVKTRDVQML